MDIEFITLAWSRDSGYQSAHCLVIDSPEQWINCWQLHTCHAEPPLPAPQVDFTRYSIIAVFAGEKPASEYSVEIMSVEVTGTEEQPSIAITVQHHQPKPGDFVIEMRTYPNHIIKIPKVADRNKVTFNHI